MKNKLLMLLIVIVLFSCNKESKNKMKVYMSNGNGWDMSSTEMLCDSVTMINKNSAIVYINGYKSIIYADVILINISQ